MDYPVTSGFIAKVAGRIVEFKRGDIIAVGDGDPIDEDVKAVLSMDLYLIEAGDKVKLIKEGGPHPTPPEPIPYEDDEWGSIYDAYGEEEMYGENDGYDGYD